MEGLGKVINNRKKVQSVAAEILLILTVFCLFMTSACISKRSDAAHYAGIFALVGAGDILILFLWICLALSCRERAMHLWREKGIVSGKILGPLGAILFCLVSRAVQLGDTPRWDGLIYYGELMRACQNFNFTWGSFLNGFSLAAHPTMGFAGLAAIGEFLNEGGYAGVLATQLILNLFMAFCLYKIICGILPSCSWIYHCLATCTGLATPLTLGTFSYFQPDAGTVYAFVFILYCVLYRKNILLFFCMMLLASTKEVGVVILGGFGVGLLLGKILFGREGKNPAQRFWTFLKSPLGIAGSIAGVCLLIYLIYFFASGKSMWMVSNDNIEGFSTFSFQPDYIIFKCKQFFVLNFNWLIWSGILGTVLYILLRSWKRKGFSVFCAYPEMVVSLLMTEAMLILFYCSYVTYGLPRYHVLIDFNAVLVLVILLPNCVRKEQFYCPAVAILSAILFLEAYVTIDPVSLVAFETRDTGNGKIVTERLGSGVTGQADFCVYNHRFNYLDKAYNEILKDVNYHEGMDVLVWERSDDYGFQAAGVYWDLEEEKMVYSPGENRITIRGTERKHFDSGAFIPGPEAVFISTPQFGIAEDVAEEYLKQYYEIRYKGYVDVALGGKVTFYVCDLVSVGGSEG